MLVGFKKMEVQLVDTLVFVMYCSQIFIVMFGFENGNVWV